MTDEIKFDSERAKKYDRDTRVIIPGYEALHSMAYALLGVDLGSSANVLIVGSGTGEEILNLSKLNPQWQFTGVDPSADMMAVAQTRITEQGLSSQAQLHLGTTDELPEAQLYDAATLILVMHFVPDDGSKLALLQSIAKRLKKGAIFILADLHGDKNSKQFHHFMAAWKLREIMAGLSSQEEIEKGFQRRMNSIQFIPEARLIELLHTAGFIEVERFYGAYLFGGWVAKLAGAPSISSIT